MLAGGGCLFAANLTSRSCYPRAPPNPNDGREKGRTEADLRHRKPLRISSVLGGLVAAQATKGRTRVV